MWQVIMITVQNTELSRNFVAGDMSAEFAQALRDGYEPFFIEREGPTAVHVWLKRIKPSSG
jgi:hypothetical protein